MEPEQKAALDRATRAVRALAADESEDETPSYLELNAAVNDALNDPDLPRRGRFNIYYRVFGGSGKGTT
jgi:hypothetical protein